MSERVLTPKEIEANVEKTLAEIEALRAKTIADAAEAQAKSQEASDKSRQAEVLLRKTVAEAEAEEARATILKIDANTKQRGNQRELAKDEHHRIYVFDQAVGSKTVTDCIQRLAEWSRIDPKCNIEIVFNSPGGSVIDGMALYDYLTQLKAQGHNLVTSSLGMAASMAGILLQAGNTRRMGSEAWLLIHQGSFGAGGSVGQVEDTVEWVKKIQVRILDIFAAKSNLSKAQIKTRWHRKDWWLDSDEALKLGFIDEIA